MVITRTPFRMSFFGGGTDFPEFFRNYGGSVLSATFDKYCYVTLRPLPGFFDYESEFVYSRIERVHTNREILHPAIRNAMIHWEVSHVRLNYEADLPARTGLGTSSSFAVGMLHAIHAARGETVDKRVLADEAIYLERTLCGECGGWQDQIAASFGGLNRIDFYGDGYTVRPVEMPAARKAALSDSLMLFFTGISRYSFDLQTAHRDAIALQTATLSQMRAMVDTAEVILRGDGPLSDFGELLHESWLRKRTLTGRVSTPLVDEAYENARAAGALGGKLLGAGGGGFLLFFVPQEKKEAVRRALSPLIEVSFSFEEEGSALLFRNGLSALT